MTAREILRMVVVLALVTGFWGGALSLVNMATEEQIEYQKLKNIKEPALKQALSSVDYDNDPLQDRMSLEVGKDSRGQPQEQIFFLAKKNDELQAVALEASAGGYEGDVGVMISILLDKEEVGSVDVTTHSETQGVGTKAIDSQDFMGQFKSKPLDTNFAARSPDIDARSGATTTSHAIQNAVQKGVEIFEEHKSKILEEEQ
ncbi:MAG: FMN-binding protein [Desulfohalobiaceae bacterium]